MATSFAHFQLVVLQTFHTPLENNENHKLAQISCQVFSVSFSRLARSKFFALIARGICRDASASLSWHLANIIALWKDTSPWASVPPKSSSWGSGRLLWYVGVQLIKAGKLFVLCLDFMYHGAGNTVADYYIYVCIYICIYLGPI